jgi:UDP-sulfoquinovose synthase
MDYIGEPKKVIVLGGDGFVGWPTALHLSEKGHEVIIVDNLSRRNIDNELECESLTPIQPIGVRIKAWKEVSGKTIRFVLLDVAEDYDQLVQLFINEKPTTVIHFAEQRAAPYSMKTSKHKRYTVNNNVNATNNILCAIIDSRLDIHLVHLGTMGVYLSFSPRVPLLCVFGFFDRALYMGTTQLELKSLRDTYKSTFHSSKAAPAMALP